MLPKSLPLFIALFLCSFSFGNDHFADRTPLTLPLPISFSDSLQDATKELGEPNHTYNKALARKPYQSKWWTWTPSTSSTYQIKITSASLHHLSLHTGDQLDLLLTHRIVDQAPSGTPIHLTFQATAGQAYHIALASSHPSPAPFNFALTAAPDQPSNDHFIDAIDLGELSITGDSVLSGSNFGATSESGEPNHQGWSPRHSVWWKFTPPTHGWCYLEKLTPVFGRISLYQGNTVKSLSEVKPGRWSAEGIPPSFSRSPFYLHSGQSYFLSLDDFGPVITSPSAILDHASIRFHFEAPPIVPSSSPPANDHFTNATYIPDFTHTTFSADISGATREPSERSHLGSNSHPDVQYHSAWWTWIATTESTFSLRKRDSSYHGIDCIIYQTSTSGAMTRVLSHKASTLTRPRFTTVPGLRYHAVLVSSHELYNLALSASYQLTKLTSPSNQSLTTAFNAAERPTLVLDEDSVPRDTPLFWFWNPPHDGLFPISIDGATALSVFNGSSEDPQEFIPPHPRSNDSQTLFSLKKNQPITIRANANPAWIRTISVDIAQLPSPPNDAFSEALPLQTYPHLNPRASSVNAITEADEPLPNEDGTLWWIWTPPSPGAWTFNTNSNTILELFQGNQLSNLTQLPPLFGTPSTFQFQNPLNPIYLRASNRREVEIEVWQDSETFNDSRAQAITIPSTLPASAHGTLYNSTSQPGEPGIRNSWWTWTATTTQPVQIKNRDLPHLQIFEGTKITPLSQLVPIDSIFTQDEETVVFIPKINQSYLICAFHPIERTLSDLSVRLQLEHTLISKGDLQSDPIDLGQNFSARFQGTTLTPFPDPDAPRQFLKRDRYRWLHWTCPKSGAYQINVESLAGDPFESFILYSKGVDGQLSRLGSGDEDDQPMFVNFTAQAETEYLIAPEPDGQSEKYFVSIFPIRGFEDWYAQHYSPYETPDRNARIHPNGLTNLERYFFGLSSNLPQSLDRNASNLPRKYIDSENLTLRYRLPPLTSTNARPLFHTGEVSLDGITWTSVPPSPLGGNLFLVQVPLDSEKKLLRIRVWETKE